MSKTGDKKPGFTIVELLVVIVVIGVLAGIVTVTYTGIQGKVYDVAVRNDISNLSKIMQIFYLNNGQYVRGSQDMAVAFDNGDARDFRMSSRSAYASSPTTSSNLSLCTAFDGQSMAIASLSKSGRAFYAYSEDGFVLKEMTSAQWAGSDTTASQRCQAISSGLGTYHVAGNGVPYYMVYNGYNANDTTTGPWRAWTKSGPN